MKRWLTLLLVALQILACCFGNIFFGTACPASIARAESQYRTLKPGVKGQDVLEARKRLYELGYFKKVPTQTEYTTNMKSYVKKFEKDYGLKQDGILSPEDQEVLFGGKKEAPAATPVPSAGNTSYETVAISPDVKAGDVVTLGKWEQDNKTKNGKEPIQWRVLTSNGTTALLVSVDGLDVRAYEEGNLHEVSNKAGLNWETSDLRSWLNGAFYKDAFTAKEQNLIVSAKNKTVDMYGTIITEDKVFCLSADEVKKYFTSPGDMACRPSAYSNAKITINGGGTDADGYGIWWLRDMRDVYDGKHPFRFGSDSINSCTVVFQQEGLHPERVFAVAGVSNGYCVRPAMWVRIKQAAAGWDLNQLSNLMSNMPSPPHMINISFNGFTIFEKYNNALEGALKKLKDPYANLNVIMCLLCPNTAETFFSVDKQVLFVRSDYIYAYASLGTDSSSKQRPLLALCDALSSYSITDSDNMNLWLLDASKRKETFTGESFDAYYITDDATYASILVVNHGKKIRNFNQTTIELKNTAQKLLRSIK